MSRVNPALFSSLKMVCERIDGLVYTVAGTRSAQPDENTGIVLCVLFHRLFDEEGANGPEGETYPHERMTLTLFRQVLDHFVSEGFQFLAPSDLCQDKHLGKRSVIISFDDGYAENLTAMAEVTKRSGKASMFAVAGSIQTGHLFWVDALYRGARSAGWSSQALNAAIGRLRRASYPEVKRELEASFGPEVFDPKGRSDRPLTRQELVDLARSSDIEIGNHTLTHTALSGRKRAYVDEQISRSQDALSDMLGGRPVSISYPNGRCNRSVVASCQAAGLKIGFTTAPGLNRLGPYDGSAKFMTLQRYTVSGRRELDPQLRTMVKPYSTARIIHKAKTLVYD